MLLTFMATGWACIRNPLFVVFPIVITFSYLHRSIYGAFGGVLGALILAIIGDIIPNERRASAMGVVMASFSVASL